LTTLLLAGALSAAAAAAQPSLPALPHPATYNAIGVAVGVHGAVGVDFFYSNLAPYGYWVDRPSYGWVWVPRHARHAWRPYSSGRWAYTDYGWTWVSSEPFGWATYHYGRWYDDPDYGWGWVPGTDWGPAWVDWREGGGYLGWAPLPPSVGFSASVGLQFGGGFGLDPGAYCFVPERHFLDANVGGFIGSPGRNAAFFNNTRNINNYAVVNGRVFNRSVPLDRIQQVTGRPVPQMRLAAASDPRTARVSGNTVSMFRPAAVVRRANAPDPAHVVPHAVATGRVAQQLQQAHRGMAAASARGTQAQLRQQGGTRGAVTSRGTQTQMRRQGSTRGGQAVTRGNSLAGHRQVTPPPQRTRGGIPPRRGARSQQVHQYVPPSQHGRGQAVARGGSMAGRRQVTPPPQRTRGGTPPRNGARSQQVHQYVPPSQHARGMSSPMAQRQPQAQVRRQSAPPLRQAPPQRMQQAPQRMPQPQVMRQPASPPRQMQARQQPPPRPQQQARAQAPRRQQQPPPGGPGNR
jgi:hypothetical protein